jgi:hypothetical protein
MRNRGATIRSDVGCFGRCDASLNMETFTQVFTLDRSSADAFRARCRVGRRMLGRGLGAVARKSERKSEDTWRAGRLR